MRLALCFSLMDTVLGLLSSSIMVGGTENIIFRNSGYRNKKVYKFTDNVKVTRHGDHGVCVDLTHVVTLVLRLDVPDLQGPGVVTVVDDVKPGDAGDHVTPDGQDHLAVNVDPGHLRERVLCYKLNLECLMRFAQSLLQPRGQMR